MLSILQSAKTIAVVGMSSRPERASNSVPAYLQAQGYRIIPVNPSLDQVLGEQAYPDVLSVPEPIDVVDISRVIQVEPPLDADSYTHRSGRTARAGRKGTSSLLVTPLALKRTQRLLESARVKARFEPIPSAAQIEKANDDLQFAGLTAPDPEGFAGFDERKGTVVLPKFKIEYEHSLNLALKKLGMGLAFAPAADFSRMVVPRRSLGPTIFRG